MDGTDAMVEKICTLECMKNVCAKFWSFLDESFEGELREKMSEEEDRGFRFASYR